MKIIICYRLRYKWVFVEFRRILLDHITFCFCLFVCWNLQDWHFFRSFFSLLSFYSLQSSNKLCIEFLSKCGSPYRHHVTCRDFIAFSHHATLCENQSVLLRQRQRGIIIIAVVTGNIISLRYGIIYENQSVLRQCQLGISIIAVVTGNIKKKLSSRIIYEIGSLVPHHDIDFILPW